MPLRTLIIAGLVAAAVAAGVWTRPGRVDAAAPFDGEPELVAVTFASAWCASCKILVPKLAKVIPEFADRPVAFVELDFTFGARDDVARIAERYGLAGLYQRNKGATGFTVLVDRNSGEILDTLTMNFSEDAIRQAVARALAIATHTNQASPAVDAEM